eukprot:4539577-Heterocapsa_arctica.AAC.1
MRTSRVKFLAWQRLHDNTTDMLSPRSSSRQLWTLGNMTSHLRAATSDRAFRVRMPSGRRHGRTSTVRQSTPASPSAGTS